MTKKELMLGAFYGDTQEIPVTPHWWGLYKFQHGGLMDGYSREAEAWSLRGEELACYDTRFYEDFAPDMFHLTTGSSRLGNLYATEEYLEARRKLRELNSDRDIDDFVKLIRQEREEVMASGCFDHVKQLQEVYGKEHFLCVHEGNPVCVILDEYLGFEDGLIAMLEKPERIGYLLHQLYDALLPRMEAIKAMGADAYAGSETYCTPDIMAPGMYRDLVLPAQKYFYRQVKKLGLVPITYFLGNVMPLMDCINELGVDGLMVEESKKDFRLDVVEIRKKLNADITLFGNLDSVYILQKGTPEEVRQETERQLTAARYGRFIMSNGCPISFDTPKENIRSMIETTHNGGIL